jgi:hypothetical protein
LAPAVNVVPTAPPLSAQAPAVCCSATCAAVAPAAACCAIASDAGSPAVAPYAQRTKTGCARSASVAAAAAPPPEPAARPRPKKTLTPAAALQLAFSGQTSLAPPSAESAAGWAWPLAKASTSVTAQLSRPEHEVAPAAFGATKA